MNNYSYPYPQQQQYNSYQQIQQMFPQPQGSVYSITTPIEVGNVPIGSTGLSIALCLNESIMYIKSFQNGSPVIIAYHITPYTKDASKSDIKKDDVVSSTPSPTLEERLQKLETLLTQSKGGKFDELL